MHIVGYSDKLSVSPGNSLQFMVSTDAPNYNIRLVRLVHGNADPAGPGFKEEEVPNGLAQTLEGQQQLLYPGSYVTVPNTANLEVDVDFRLSAIVWPTYAVDREQAILTRWNAEERRGYGLVLTKDGELACHLGDGRGEPQTIRLRGDLHLRRWYRVEAVYQRGQVKLTCLPLEPTAEDRPRTVTAETSVSPDAHGIEVHIAAWREGNGKVGGHYNGKIERPQIARSDGAIIADWDFAHGMATSSVIDRGPRGLHGTAVNLPSRAVKGSTFSGKECCFRLAPQEYGAIWFHDDDLEDAGWRPAVEYRVPHDLHSGIYAMRLRCGTAEDHVPFFVTPTPGAPSSSIALVLPTYTYLAYANDTNTWRGNPAIRPSDAILQRLQDEDHYAVDQRLRSMYDVHSDGSGVGYASRLRPLVNMRPRYRLATVDAPHGLGSDLHITDWLEHKRLGFDVLTDDELDDEMDNVLKQYRVVLTGTHPEYASGSMLEKYQSYVHSGGRLMYLGGNGFYWVVSAVPEKPYALELRRGRRGAALWRSEPGEDYHASTGELGGLWRDRDRAPQRLVGVGFIADGIGRAVGYRRLADSFTPFSEFVFQGIAADEIIGDFGLVLGGAGGHEVDRVDFALGSPHNTLRLATTLQLPDEYHLAIEEVLTSDSRQHATANRDVYGDIALVRTAEGGVVFSVGSIAWCGALSHNDYDNNVSRITENVMMRFLDESPL